MSDARIRELEAAVQRGEPGAREALRRARERITACARCNGSGLVVDPAKVREVQSGKWDHRAASTAIAAGLWTVPCPECSATRTDAGEIEARRRLVDDVAARGYVVPSDAEWSLRYDLHERAWIMRVTWSHDDGRRFGFERAL